jgi:1,2-diacylglycerol 3-beta-galactosyltransferase
MRILVAMSDTGGGHRSLASAVKAGLIQQYPRVQVDIVDMFRPGHPTLAWRVVRLYGPVIRRAPGLYGALFHTTNLRGVYPLIAKAYLPSLLPKVVRFLREYRPDLVVSVHPLLNRVLLDAIERLGRPVQVAAVVSELVTVHRSWVEPEIRYYSVATEEARAHMERWKAPMERTEVTGLPVDPRFRPRDEPDLAVRRQLGLSPNTFTVLVMAGGEGTPVLLQAVKALGFAGLPVQLIVVCGRNSTLEKRVRALGLPTEHRVFGFTDRIPELMAAADVVVTKGGPQTLAEVLAVGRPALVVQTLPGQEEGNDVYIQSRGAGLSTPNPDSLLQAVRRLVTEPDYRYLMAKRARELGRPDAAFRVGRSLMELME